MARSTTNTKGRWLSTLSIALCGSLLITPTNVQAQDTPSLSRWGQAIAYIPSPPSILLHGGKSDTSNSFSYTSAPNTDDTLLVPLSSGFSASTSPAIITLDAPDSPAYAWHTLTPFSSSDGKWDVLSFGGDGGPSEAIQTRADSAWYLTLDSGGSKADWKRQAEGWGSQPTRRIYHSAVGGGGKVYITGGLRNDGSGTSFSQVYEFDPAKGFTELAPLPRATYHHASFMLPNGTLVVLGGVVIDLPTGVPATRLLSTVATLDIANPSASWVETIIPGIAPQARRAMAAALSQDGKTVFIHGGASVTFAEVYSDAWTLDLDTLAWTEAGQSAVKRHVARQEVAGPGRRYDHSAILAPGGQVIILGGYGGNSVTDPGPFVFNLPEGSWQSEYTPQPIAQQSFGPSDSNPTATPAGGDPAATGPTNAQSTPASTPIDASASQPDSVSMTASGASSALIPSASTSDTPEEASSGMSLSAQLGLIFGILAVAGMGIAVFIWRYRRRRRHERIERAIYGLGPSQPPSRPYGSRDKGGEGLMEEARNMNEKDTSPLPPTPSQKQVGLGLGSITATFASLRGFVKKPTEAEAYAVLHDEGAPTPARKPTRKVGQGIRLIGPRSPPRASENRQSRASIMSPDSRRDMLSDEDSRNFPKAQDWEVGDLGQSNWKSARSILADHEEDPFEDDDESLYPPVIRGGPVPTPHESTANLDPFNDEQHATSDIGDYGLPHVDSDPLLDLDALLPVPSATMHKRYSGMSSDSGPSTAMTDVEEAVIQHAHFASPGTTASLFSPAESSYQPIKRTDTFFKRMAAGGISSLLPSSSKSLARSQSSSTSLFDIRDPAPPPSLWPVVSRDMLTNAEAGLVGYSAAAVTAAGVMGGAAAGVTKPPTAWRGGNNLSIDTVSAQRPTHHPGPSLSSITSARSMRDMVIVQREPTSSSGESATIEHAPHRYLSGHHGHERYNTEDEESDTSGSDHRDVKPRGTPGGGLVVFDGADFASPVSTIDTPIPEVSNGFVPTIGQSSTPLRTDIHLLEPMGPPLSTSTTRAPTTPSSTVSFAPSVSTPTPTRTPRVPSGSPIPQPLLSHRRPVSEMVKSINKRGSGSASGSGLGNSGSGSSNASPLSLFSPASQYSPASPTRAFGTPPNQSAPAGFRPSGLKRPTTLYEAVKRDKLQVANPDWARR